MATRSCRRCFDGEVDEVDILRDKTLMDNYTRNESKVNLALKSRARQEMLFEVDKLRAGIFQKTIVWATGASDQGKTLPRRVDRRRIGGATGLACVPRDGEERPR
ncbi:MAG: hypothetical protein R2692_02355 [Microbacterium sp.]